MTMTCNFCGASCSGPVAEVIEWDRNHRNHCKGEK